MPHKLTLVSNALCPFVQRAIIVALEKGVPHERIYIDLSNKPDWFLKLSPTGKVPLLQVDDTVLFESVVIAEYLDETSAGRLSPRTRCSARDTARGSSTRPACSATSS